MITVSVPRGRGFAYACAALLIAAGCAGCGSSATTPSDNVPFAQTDLRIGAGADAVAGKTVTVSYTGWLYDATQAENKGTLFQSSPGFSFVLGTAAVIPGWDQGIPGMKVGGLRRLTIPSNLAYGANGNGSSIPPNATLIFEVGLLAVQ